MGGELARLKSIGYGDHLSLVSRRMIHYSLKRADRITVGSQYLKSIARDYLSQKQMNQVHYLPLGVNGSMFCTQANSQSSSQTRDKIDILHVGSLVPVKNQRALLQALPLVLKKRAAHLHLIGKGPLAKDLKHLASSLNIWNHITFHGEIPHHHLSEYYARADLFMLTSLFESQGMVVLEAAACGVPIVGTAVGVLPELQPAVKCLPTNALNDLPEVILELLAAPDNLQEMAKAVRLQVTKNFLIEQTVTRLLQIYNHLL
ncbi:MAG: glycosyltransferase family 4 protein, partial [bacterium]